jgi:hypothetical protein
MNKEGLPAAPFRTDELGAAKDELIVSHDAPQEERQ